MGIYDGKKVDSAVMIRFIEQNAQGKYLFKSGGGITAKSKIHNEYNEIKQKIYGILISIIKECTKLKKYIST